MQIGEAAKNTGVNAKMIRYYESVALLRPAARQGNSYRDYGERDIHELRFIGRARKLGFSVEEIGALLSLWRDQARPSRDVREIAGRHLEKLDARIIELQGMADVLRHLVQACHGDGRPDCPILDDLSAAEIFMDR